MGANGAGGQPLSRTEEGRGKAVGVSMGAADRASLECRFAFLLRPRSQRLGCPSGDHPASLSLAYAEPGRTTQEGQPPGCLIALVVFDPVTFSVLRSDAGDCQGLLENDLAGELGQHRHGHEPRGSGQGKPLPQLPGQRLLALSS